jgi:hypothetical protein
MNEEPTKEDVLTLLLVNQQKIMAQSQVILIHQARLIAALTGKPAMEIMEEAEQLYRQEKNKLHLANFAELRALQGKPSSENSGGGLGGAG